MVGGVFSLILSGGKLAGALTAIGICLLGVWKIIQWCRKQAAMIAKTYNSVGQINGDGRTIAENVKDTRKMAQAALYKYDEFALWRGAVDVRLENIDRTLHAQNGVLDEIKARQV